MLVPDVRVQEPVAGVLAEQRRQRADYMKRYRRTNWDAREDAKAAERAVGRALTRLRALHPRQFRRLVDEERAEEGLPPLGTLPVGRPRRDAGDAA